MGKAEKSAYSWWWASHIRTKQSKWVQQSLQDMEENVQGMLKLIEEDGDSFAKRAEMYYRRRPELITSVEEAYRAFRALADRYDYLSRELHNANHTIATVFPEQVQLTMDEDDESVTKIAKNFQMPVSNTESIINAPKKPNEEEKGLQTTAPKQLPDKIVENSNLNEDETLLEIDKIQDDILALQTVKEFVKSSYESGLSKYLEIENQIMGMQQKMCKLNNKFILDPAIEDDETQKLMVEVTESCTEALIQSQEQLERSAIDECMKTETAYSCFHSLENEYLTVEWENDYDKTSKLDKNSQILTQEVIVVRQEMTDVIAPENVNEDLNVLSTESLTMFKMEENMNKLMDKVFSLETEVSSQTDIISTLRTKADDHHSLLQKLEDEKVSLIDGAHTLTSRLKEMEDKLNKLQDLNKSEENQNSNSKTNFTNVNEGLENMSRRLKDMKPDEEHEETSSAQDQSDVPTPDDGKNSTSKPEDEMEAKEANITDGVKSTNSNEGEDENSNENPLTLLDQKPNNQVLIDHSDDLINAQIEKEELSLQQMLLSGMEDREKILLKEYTTILRNYKDIKKSLFDMKKQGTESQFDVITRIRELKDAILEKDEEILHLHQRLNVVQEIEDIQKNCSQLSNSIVDRGFKPELETEDYDAIENQSKNKEDDIKLVCIDGTPIISVVEEKLRMDIDSILDENLDFWLRFSTSFHQIQKFKTEVQDLKGDILKLLEKKAQVGSLTDGQKFEVRAIYKHLRELQMELTVWLDQSVSLKDEHKRRFASLFIIQDEIAKVGMQEEDIRFSNHQAAKFQGELLNMKLENNKVGEELQGCLDSATALQLEILQSLRKLIDEFGIANDHLKPKNTMSRPHIHLRSFIFGSKHKRHKHFVLPFIHRNKKSSIVRDRRVS